MAEERIDGETRSLLEELWAAPVGRRWFLKAGVGSAAAAGAALYGSPAAAGAARRKATGVETTDLHFALGHARGVRQLAVVANGQRVPLVRHTAKSRSALRRRGGVWRAIDPQALTHYVPKVKLPSHRGMLVSVYGHRGRREVVVAQLWYAPREATLAFAKAAHGLTGSLHHLAGSSHRLKGLGLRASDVRTPADVAALETIGDPQTTAMTFTSVHPNIATVNPALVPPTKSLLSQTPAVTSMGSYIANMQSNGQDFATLVPATNANGAPAQIKLGDMTTGFSTFSLNQSDQGLRQAAKGAVSAGVVGVRDTGKLGAVIDKPLVQDAGASTQTWVQPQGGLPQIVPYSGLPKATAGVQINVKDPSLVFGTYTTVHGSYANGQVPLRLYNNYVRWVWVYVQYLGAGGENLSINPGAKWPDTKYSQSLGLLPQVFTVLGIPIWDTNTIDVTLNFPKEATTARILYAGLGSDINGGGWSQYFPAGAYDDQVAPQAEVVFPAVTTGILSIGMTIFALATDLDIATAWASIRSLFGAPTLATLQALYSFGQLGLSASETAATAVASGAATYESIKANGGSTANIWSILLNLASAIPKIIFSPGATELWETVALRILAVSTAAKILNAIPLFGEVFAALEVVGDVATLAEVSAETIASPWVIENEVSLTYDATITVSHDPRDSTFPATARKWRLEAIIDGAKVPNPQSGVINQNGKLESAPLQLSVTTPFGGSTIQWSIVMLDAAGNQVGTGVSTKLTNDDPANPPSSVAFAITELPATVDGDTVFKRASTTTYSSAAAGYTWSDQVTNTGGTVQSSDIQQVTSVAVATLAGVVGVVWEQGNRYWLRGVPVAQNGPTIKLTTTPTEGYARRPFLLLDSFVARTDVGNHVLLEPDPTTDAYHIRKVTLDSTTGAISWDSTASYGTFLLPVSAAALHASGRVVAIHTDSGRIGWLQPVNTPRSALAAYSAGPGIQTGLLSSPIAIAVTNPGVVLILEAGTSQIAAFDLNGNPVPYFPAALTRRRLVAPAGGRPKGDSAAGQFTLPLASQGTYLDLSVDGSGQMYALYYTADGSSPSDYHVDVYTASGAVLDTHSPGVNVPHLAIDYWRSIFAANYNPLSTLGTTTPRIDPALGVAEPSVSRFDPSEATLAAPAPHRRRRRRRRRRRARFTG